MTAATMQRARVETTRAIFTKFLGPTNTRGARIKARTVSGVESLTMPYPYERHMGADAHAEAAEALARRMGWTGDFAAAEARDGYVFVYTSALFAHPLRIWPEGSDT